MTEQKLILYATTPDNLVTTKTIEGINPDATNGQLKAFAQAANALTENTYNGSKKVTQVDLDSASQDKQTPTLTLSPNTLSLANIQASRRNVTVSYDGDGQYGFIFNTIQREVNITNVYENGSMEFFISATNGVTSGFEVKVITTETNTYTAAEATLTITA